MHWSDSGIAVATGDNSFVVISAPRARLLSSLPTHLQVLVFEEGGWVVKWRQDSAHSLDVNSVEWAGQHTLVTAGWCAAAAGALASDCFCCR